MAAPSAGQYMIRNAQFNTQVADLLLGQPTSTVGGVANNTNSLNMVWNVTVLDNWLSTTFVNAAPSANGTYAYVSQKTSGAVVQGVPGNNSNTRFWTLQQWPRTSPSGKYQILTSSVDLAWSLASGDDGAPITLAPTDTTYTDLTQVWTLEPVTQPGGNVARGINELD
ncbi:hypothetical protein OG21DRAFT_1520998 [Imleria badia]|nr:hypothetical protein OG21DRAFT_1520998 [Imleria badia]